jgi:hypothetical protein
MKNIYITIAADILIIIVSFCMIVLSIISMKYSVNSKTKLIQTFPNSFNSPIADIKISRWRCPSDYSPIFNFTYPGSVIRGCYCPTLNLTMYHSVCNSDFQKNFCYDIEKIPQTQASVWRNVTICYKRMDREKFYETSEVVDKNSDCPSTHRLCGIYDIFNNKLCIHKKSFVKCPINYFKILSADSPSPVNLKYEKFKLSGGYNLYYSRNSYDTLVPINFRVSENYPCIVEGRISNITEFPPFTNWTDLSFGCDPWNEDNYEYNESFLDKRYIKLDTISSDEFYTSNDMSIPMKLANYTKNSTMVYNLYMRPFHSIGVQCVNYNNTKQFYYILENTKNSQLYLMIMFLIQIFVIVIFISLLSIWKIHSKVQNSIISLLKLIFCSVFVAYVFNLVLHVFNNSTILRNRIAKINSLSCLETTSYYAFNTIYKLEEFHDKLNKSNTILFYLNFTYAGLVFIQSIFYVQKIYSRIRHRNRNKEVQNIRDQFLK